MAPQRYNHFGYCGMLAEDEISTHRTGERLPIVNSIAWCPYPKKYSEHGRDLIALTGEFGTIIHCRRNPKETRPLAENNIDEGWSILHRDASIVGRSMTWNPSEMLEAGDLAISSVAIGGAGSAGAVSSKLHLLRIPKRGGAMTSAIIFDTATHNLHDIMSACWCWDGKTILVFTNSSNLIRYLIWQKETRSWMHHTISYDSLNSPRNLVGCVPLTERNDIFAAAGLNQRIKIFRKSNTHLDPIRHWNEECSWHEYLDITAMSFCSTGLTLATLSRDGAVRVFSVSLPRLSTFGIASSSRIRAPRAESPSIKLVSSFAGDYKFIAWSGDLYLLMSGDTLASVQVVEFSAYADTMHMIHSNTDAFKDGTECIDPFNQVRQLLVCPHRQHLVSVLGYRGFVMFWQNTHYFARRDRDVFKETFPDHMPVVSNKLDLFRSDFNEYAKSLEDQLNNAMAQSSTLRWRYEKVGQKLMFYMKRAYEGKEDDLKQVLQDIYCSGRYPLEY